MKRLRYIVIAAAVLMLFVASYIVINMGSREVIITENEFAAIDEIYAAERGTVTVWYKGGKDVKIKCSITHTGGTTQNYNLDRNGAPSTLPLHGGAGQYIVTVYEQVEGTQYTSVLSVNIDVSDMDSAAPFLHPSSIVDWENGGAVVKKAREVATDDTDRDEAAAIFNYVVDSISYDADAYADAESGYIQNAARTLETGRGFCLDYAGLMVAMLRISGIPAKLVVGDAGGVYHAWVSAYINGEWVLYDPTFVSAQNRSDEIMRFVADVENYTVRYEY